MSREKLEGGHIHLNSDVFEHSFPVEVEHTVLSVYRCAVKLGVDVVRDIYKLANIVNVGEAARPEDYLGGPSVADSTLNLAVSLIYEAGLACCLGAYESDEFLPRSKREYRVSPRGGGRVKASPDATLLAPPITWVNAVQVHNGWERAIGLGWLSWAELDVGEKNNAVGRGVTLRPTGQAVNPVSGCGWWWSKSHIRFLLL